MPEIKIKINPFIAPNCVSLEMPHLPREAGIQQHPVVLLGELSADVLGALSDEFRMAVFKKAGKADPNASSL